MTTKAATIHIRNNTLKTHGLPNGIQLKPGVLEGNVFVPGVTVVDAELWKKTVNEHTMVQKHIDEKHFEEHKPTAAEKKAEVAVVGTSSEPPTPKAQADEIKKAESKK